MVRTHLPTQETWVQSLIWEASICHAATKPLHHNHWALAVEPSCNYWACERELPKSTCLEPVLCNERSHCHWEVHTPQLRVAPAQHQRTLKQQKSNKDSVQWLSLVQLCNPMDCSTPNFPVHHQLPELAQTHIHQVGDAIQPSHPLSSPSAFDLSQHQMAKVLELQHQSFQWIFRTDFLNHRLVWSPCSPRDSQESSPTPQFKSINSLALSFLYSPTLTSIHDYWKNHNFD